MMEELQRSLCDETDPSQHQHQQLLKTGETSVVSSQPPVLSGSERAGDAAPEGEEEDNIVTTIDEVSDKEPMLDEGEKTPEPLQQMPTSPLPPSPPTRTRLPRVSRRGGVASAMTSLISPLPTSLYLHPLLHV
ncbi:hypothetical protein GBAR_LOCUS15823 [Geodia barretti]|uniref:Uncharacterized protein n=1 Tax=Geodia barretti TaxID=519541 RepID=A0AA35SDS9_GEOBA|nr:hypothetical protein GBAR_LOCUS15823 [Geodia barretti]